MAKGTVVLQPHSHLTTVVSNFNWSGGTEIEDVFTGNHKKKNQKKNPGDEDEKLSRQTAATEMKVIYLLQNLKCQLQHRRQNLF